MYDIPELEKKWRKYKRNQIKKPLIIGGSIIGVLGIIAIITLTYFHFPQKEPKAKVVPTVAKVKKETQPIVITKNEVMPPSKSNEPTTPTETIDISKAKIITPNVPEEDVRMIGFDTKNEKSIQANNQDILIPSKKKKEIKELEHVKEVEERFKISQDPQDSLFLARYYYKKGDYAKAIDWAINTNNIDGTIEESWLIFAKAQAKMGHRVDAIKALQSYYDSTGSSKAKELLDKLRFGKPFD